MTGDIRKQLIEALDQAEITEQFGVRHLDIETHRWEMTVFGDDRQLAESYADDLPWGAHATLQSRRIVVTRWAPVGSSEVTDGR